MQHFQLFSVIKQINFCFTSLNLITNPVQKTTRMKTDLLLFFSFLTFAFFSCDGESTIDFPKEVIQHSRVSDSLFQILLDDAKLLCLNIYTIEEKRQINDIEILDSHLGPIIAALQMVQIDSLLYEAAAIRKYDIHTLCPIHLYQGMLKADSTSKKIKSWLQDGYTGNSFLDDLIYEYKITIDSVSPTLYNYNSEIGINHAALASELKRLSFVSDARASSCIGDGSQIEIIDYTSDFIHFIFSYGWGDCPSGCIKRHYWEIGVYGSGIVELINESGDRLP